MAQPKDLARMRLAAREQFANEPGLQFLSFRGSVAHGTYLPSDDPDSVDDIDLIGWVVGPMDCYLGLGSYGSGGTRELKQGYWDVVLYEARKLIGLLVKGNPNVLCTLFVPRRLTLVSRWAHELLVVNRGLFLSRELYKPFVHYAHSQLKRVEHYATEGYMGAKRKRLIAKYHFDAKNASHLIRLLRTGIELLRTGELHVCRTGIDADELVAIKRGVWSLERVKREADDLFAACRDARDRSPLPERVDRAAVNELCIEVVDAALHDTGGSP